MCQDRIDADMRGVLKPGVEWRSEGGERVSKVGERGKKRTREK